MRVLTGAEMDGEVSYAAVRVGIKMTERTATTDEDGTDGIFND